MRTSLPRVWACGDVAAAPGKLKLIATGFGEAATAVAQAVRSFRPDEQLQPGYSTDTGVPGPPPPAS
jgi:thioredoxin reductase (NADPH)